MRPIPWLHLERFRLPAPHGGAVHRGYGAFRIPHPSTTAMLFCIASDGSAVGDEPATGWEHVSVSTRKRTPNWYEMEHVCRLFWSEDETVMQLHPPRSDWVSNHPHCLHLWKPVGKPVPRPPSLLVGIASLGQLE